MEFRKLMPVALVFACMSAPALAAPKKSRLDCTIKVNGNKNTVSFAVSDLGSLDAALLTLGATDDEGPILQGEDNQEISSMNDQGGDLRVDDKTLELVGDGDGCTFVRIVLYKSTGYKRGWASESGSEVPHWYTKDVRCTVKAME